MVDTELVRIVHILRARQSICWTCDRQQAPYKLATSYNKDFKCWKSYSMLSLYVMHYSHLMDEIVPRSQV